MAVIFGSQPKDKGSNPLSGADGGYSNGKRLVPPPLAADGSTETGLSTNPRRGCDKVFEENPKEPVTRVQPPYRR